MAIGAAVRVAVAFSAASALSVTEGVDAQHLQRTKARWSMSTDLPRAELQSKDQAASGCGKDFPGYFTIDGLAWASAWKSKKSWNISACARQCDENQHCIGFTARQPRHGKLSCWMYKGLQMQADHLGMSYMRCIKGFECRDGFQFSHAGTWRAGIRIRHLDDEDMEECRTACHKDRGCVGFTYRVNNQDDRFCLHFEDEDNRQGPSRDSRATTYSRCAQVGVLRAAAEVLSEEEEEKAPAPSDEQVEDGTVLVTKTAPLSEDEEEREAADTPPAEGGMPYEGGMPPAASMLQDAIPAPSNDDILVTNEKDKEVNLKGVGSLERAALEEDGEQL